MKKLAGITAIVITFALLFAGCTRYNPGPITTNTYDLKDFTRVIIGSAFAVEIVQENTWGVSVTAQENLFQNINVIRNGDKLEINLRWGWGTWLSNWKYQQPKVRICMPVLTGLDLTGASKGTVAGFKSGSIADINVSGASFLQIDLEASDTRLEISGASRVEGKIKATDLRAEISGASRITLDGAADKISLEASGVSMADLENYKVQSIDIDLSGASRATVSPEKRMKVTISGASSLIYTGNPILEGIDISGASTIKKK